MAWINIDFKSETLNMPVMLDILIPQGHGGYKTLYLLHGAGGDHSSWLINSRVADYAEHKNIAIVMPSADNKCYVNNRHGKDYSDYITKELIDKCEAWFSLSKNKEDRYIAGMSMGGYGAFYSALEHPDLYNKAFSYSGLLNILARYDNPQGLDMYPVFGDRKELIECGKDLFTKAEKSKNSFKDTDNATQFYIYCGLGDTRLDMSRDMYDCMSRCGYNVYKHESEGDHSWQYWDKCIQETIHIIE